jgi:cation-transporting ATPase 13A1
MQGRPFREGIRENSALYWGLVGASCVAFSGATDFIPELNRWLQVVEMDFSVSHRRFDCVSFSANSQQFKLRLTASMIIDFMGCWAIETVCKYLFADLEPKFIITRGRERRERRRAREEIITQDHQVDSEKKTQ